MSLGRKKSLKTAINNDLKFLTMPIYICSSEVEEILSSIFCFDVTWCIPNKIAHVHIYQNSLLAFSLFHFFKFHSSYPEIDFIFIKAFYKDFFSEN